MLKAIATKGRRRATGLLIVASCLIGYIGFLAAASA